MCIAQTKNQFTTKKQFLMKRRLPGRLTSARLNLNKLWSELEDLYVGRTSSSLLVLPELHEHENVEEQNRINEEREMLEKINS